MSGVKENWRQRKERLDRAKEHQVTDTLGMNRHATVRGDELDGSQVFRSEKAERAVVASVLLDPSAMADLVDVVEPDDFVTTPSASIYRAMARLWKQGVPATPVTLIEELKMPEPETTLMDMMMSLEPGQDAYVVYYAKIIARQAERRRFFEAMSDGVANLYRDSAMEVEDVIASVANHAVGNKKFNNLQTVREAMDETIEAVSMEYAGVVERMEVPTKFKKLDELLGGGFGLTDLSILAARSSMGKALALDTPIPTPSGWSTMGELQVGDVVFDENGKPCRVTYATPIQLNRTCYRVTFSDRTSVVADADHLWHTTTVQERRGLITKFRESSVSTTEEIRSTLIHETGSKRVWNHRIPRNGALEYPEKDQPIPAYVLGAWIGDGHTRGGAITNLDDEVYERIRAEGYEVSPDRSAMDRARTHTIFGLQVQLRDLGLLGNKHIPDVYKFGSVQQRIDLLSGLMDTDGSIQTSGVCEFCSTIESVARDVQEIVRSLGRAASLCSGDSTLDGVKHKRKWRVRFHGFPELFAIKRKAERVRPVHDDRGLMVSIVGIDPMESVPVRCIQVDSPNHLYLAGYGMTVTHNTSLAADFLVAASDIGTAVMFSTEMATGQVMRRFASRESGVPMNRIRSGMMTQEEYDRFMHAAEAFKHRNIVIDDTPDITTDQMKLRVQRLQAQGRVSMIVFDYLELAGDKLNDGKENDMQRMSEVVKRLKVMARQLEVPVIALSQVGRQVEQRPNKVPMLSDLRMSGMIEQTADTVLFMYIHDYYVNRGIETYDASREGVLEVHVAKNRNGPVGQVNLSYDQETFRFSDLEY